MTATHRTRVLVLDDSPVVLDLVSEAIEAAGWEPLVALDLAQMHLLLAERPDVLVLDVNMPEAYGDDVGAVLRDVRGLRAPMVLFSSLAEGELAARAAEQGFDDYVSKDAGVETLMSRIRALLASRGA
jgi:two-component system OmpR family response regulator